MDKITTLLAGELKIKPSQVEATLQLLDSGNTVPFVARYRKEVTGTIRPDDIILKNIAEQSGNTIAGTVLVRTFLGKSYQYEVETSVGKLLVNGTNEAAHQAGDKVRLFLPPSKIVLV